MQRPSPLSLLSSGGCVPANLTAEIPDSVNSAVAACMSPLRRFGRSPAPLRRLNRRRSRSTASLSCLASQLNITTDTGVDAAALDTVLESLSSDTNFTDQLKTSADTCLAALNDTLTTDQQGIYIISCLKLSLKADCAQAMNATTCLNAKMLFKCPIGILTLIDSSQYGTCKRRAISSMFTGLRDGTLTTNLDRCSTSKVNCTLQEAGLASGDSVDLTAVQTAITASTVTTDSEKALQQTVLDTCQTNGADTVEAFLDCWATESASGCITSTAERLATMSTTPTSTRTSFGSRRPTRPRSRFGSRRRTRPRSRFGRR